MRRVKTSDYILAEIFSLLIVVGVGRMLRPDILIIDILEIFVKSQIPWWW